MATAVVADKAHVADARRDMSVPLPQPERRLSTAEFRNCQISAGQSSLTAWLSRYEAWYWSRVSKSALTSAMIYA